MSEAQLHTTRKRSWHYGVRARSPFCKPGTRQRDVAWTNRSKGPPVFIVHGWMVGVRC